MNSEQTPTDNPSGVKTGTVPLETAKAAPGTDEKRRHIDEEMRKLDQHQSEKD